MGSGKGERASGVEEEGNYREKHVWACMETLLCRYMIETAEKAEQEYEKKKQKEENRIRNYGWNIFSEVRLHSESDG